MIYAIQRLNRPEDTEFLCTEAGRLRFLKYRFIAKFPGAGGDHKERFDQSHWPGAVAYGWIPPETITRLPLYRTLEYYNFPTTVGTIFVERLWAKVARSKMVPYKIRYRYADWVDSYVYPRGIGAVRNVLAGQRFDAPGLFVDPRTHFLMTVQDDASDHLIDYLDRVIDTSGKSPISLGSVCPDSYTVNTTAQHVEPLAQYLTRWDRVGCYASEEEVMTLADEDMEPQLLMADEVTAHVLDTTSASPKFLRDRLFGGLLPLDISLPAPVNLNGSAPLYASHVSLGEIAERFDRLLLTDLDVIYRRGRGDPQILTFTDRYGIHYPDYEGKRHGLVTDAIDKLVETFDRWPQTKHAAEYRLIKTHNEEALVECRDEHGHTITLLHFDLALMSLCSLGVADTDDLPPTIAERPR